MLFVCTIHKNCAFSRQRSWFLSPFLIRREFRYSSTVLLAVWHIFRDNCHRWGLCRKVISEWILVIRCLFFTARKIPVISWNPIRKKKRRDPCGVMFEFFSDKLRLYRCVHGRNNFGTWDFGERLPIQRQILKIQVFSSEERLILRRLCTWARHFFFQHARLISG